MKKAILYAANIILFVWGILMCLMNITQVWSIPWVWATLPLYVLPALFVLILILGFISTTILGALKDADKLEQTKDETGDSNSLS